MERVEYLLSQGQVDQLMEEVVSLYQQAAQNVDAVIVEGLVPDQKQVFSTFLNTKIARNLQAQTILVSSVKELGAAEIAEQLEMNIQAFGSQAIAGYILNHVLPTVDRAELAREVRESGNLKKAGLPLLGVIPYQSELLAPRTQDVARYLNANVVHAGQQASRRVRNMVVAARTAPNIVNLLKPGALIITRANAKTW
ncbi:Phosphate acetyltransferase [Chromobacterium violaceum]|uniref:Phosphate acetyltransferase n=1 Tax=Chromobacterium violaceum TaxID=536 RepID=A0A3S4HH17_CHRVL|nr:Phosphate acetyltransferase [Chromobacterium violaceum]